MSGTTAVVLAGGGRDEVCRDDPAAVNKAFVSVGGVPLVTRTLRALREASLVSQILVVAPTAAPGGPLGLSDGRRESGANISASLQSGFAELDPKAPVLVAGADLPLLTPMAVDEFLTAALAVDAPIVYGFLDRRVHESRYPTIRHTWARLREGSFCGTGLSLIRGEALPAVLSVLEAVAAARKAPWRLATLLGPRVLARYALGILGIEEIEARASALLGTRARGVRCESAESAINIDRYADLKYFRTERPPNA